MPGIPDCREENIVFLAGWWFADPGRRALTFRASVPKQLRQFSLLDTIRPAEEGSLHPAAALVARLTLRYLVYTSPVEPDTYTLVLYRSVPLSSP